MIRQSNSSIYNLSILRCPKKMTMHTYIRDLLGRDKSDEYIMNFRKIITVLTRYNDDELLKKVVVGMYGCTSSGKSVFVSRLLSCFKNFQRIYANSNEWYCRDYVNNYTVIYERDHWYVNLAILALRMLGKIQSKRILMVLDYDLSKEESKCIPIPIRFENRFEYDSFFYKDFENQISDDTFRRYFNVQVSPEEIPSLVKYFQDL